MQPLAVPRQRRLEPRVITFPMHRLTPKALVSRAVGDRSGYRRTGQPPAFTRPYTGQAMLCNGTYHQSLEAADCSQRPARGGGRRRHHTRPAAPGGFARTAGLPGEQHHAGAAGRCRLPPRLQPRARVQGGRPSSPLPGH